HFAVPLRARKLVDRLAVPIDAKPSQPIENGVDRRLRGTLAIGILDPEQHLSATPACVKPIEQSGARPADMQEAGRRGGKTGNDSHARECVLGRYATLVRLPHLAGK